MAVVCENYPEIQLSKDTFADIQRAIGGLVGELPKRGSPPGWSTRTGRKSRPSWSTTMRRARTGWLPGYLPWWSGSAPGSS